MVGKAKETVTLDSKGHVRVKKVKPEFSLDHIVLFQKLATERRKMAEESYWKVKGDHPDRQMYIDRMEYYDGLLYIIQYKLDNWES